MIEKSLIKRILIIRFSSIGDIILTTPVVRCLKQQLPGVEVHYLTKKQFQPILVANPYIDRLWLYDRDFKTLIPQLKSQGFDFVVDLHKNYRSNFVVHQLKCDHASFPKLNWQKWLLVRTGIDLLPKVHIVDRYFTAVHALGVKNDKQGLDHFIPSEEIVSLDLLPERHREGFIAVVIGGKHNTKIFPAEKVAEVAKGLQYPMVLLGGKEDFSRGERIAEACGEQVINACGNYTLNQSASLLKLSKAVLTNDTGLMHMATAFGTPIVSVWGNTIPGFGMVPYMPQYEDGRSFLAEVKGLSCRPCSKIGYETCPKRHFRCMKDIQVEAIIEALKLHLPAEVR